MIEAIRDLCAQRSVDKTPFVLLTGWGGQLGENKKLAAVGIDRVISKPVMIPKLLEEVHEVLRDLKAGHSRA